MQALIETSYQDAVKRYQQVSNHRRLPCRWYSNFERNNWYLRDRDGYHLATVELGRCRVHLPDGQIVRSG